MQRMSNTNPYKYQIYGTNHNGTAVVILPNNSGTVFANDIAGGEITRHTGSSYMRARVIFA
jgi:hypothetical protein